MYDMLETEKRKSIIDLVKREVVPAMGCTEPIAVALCVAKATEVLGAEPEKIDVYLSANMLKNAMGGIKDMLDTKMVNAADYVL